MELGGAGEVHFGAGDSWCQTPNIKHEVIEFSDDFEVIEIAMRAEFPTEEVQR